MSQVTTQAARMIAKQAGGVGLVCTELLSSNAITFRNEKTFHMMARHPRERPVAVQLFGNNPQIMAEAAKITAYDLGAEIVDINMGCWVPKVAGKGAGAGLLREVSTATAVVKAIVEAVPDVPVTVKIRVGFKMGELTGIDFARAAQDCGVKMVAVHGRFAEQGFHGQADWSLIKRVKEQVSIPVLGNGDIRTPEDAARMLNETGVNGVMIGRAAIGNPWIFRQIEHYLQTGQHLAPPTHEERIEMARYHARLTVETSQQPYKVTCLQLRSQLPPYLTGIPGKRWANEQMKHIHTVEDVEHILDDLLGRLHDFAPDHEDESEALAVADPDACYVPT
jgi:nifR3 family TIM-barrel protein